MRLASLVLLALTATASGAPQVVAPPVDGNVTFRVAVVGGAREFRIGERIPIELSFTSAVPNRYELDTATYDRSGRLESERFTVAPADGAVDPLANRRDGYIG